MAEPRPGFEVRLADGEALTARKVLLAYGLLTSGRLSNDDPRYPWLNILGTLGILLSLFYQWNLPSVIAQLLWIAVSAIALVRIHRGRRSL